MRVLRRVRFVLSARLTLDIPVLAVTNCTDVDNLVPASSRGGGGYDAPTGLPTALRSTRQGQGTTLRTPYAESGTELCGTGIG
eukprot:559866-Rhodomonas_salina.1